MDHRPMNALAWRGGAGLLIAYEPVIEKWAAWVSSPLERAQRANGPIGAKLLFFPNAGSRSALQRTHSETVFKPSRVSAKEPKRCKPAVAAASAIRPC